MKKFSRLAALLMAAAFVLSAAPYGLFAGRALALASEVGDYTYEVAPILAPFPSFIFVRTDNPDPESFMLVDKSSVYYEEGAQGEIRGPKNSNGGYSFAYTDPGTYYVAQADFADVVYENSTTRRVNGGYIFVTYGAYPDGGELVIKERTQTGTSVLNHTYQETELTVPCPAMTPYTDYLIETYTDENNSFFANMDAVQDALDEIAIYPRSVFDSSKPNEARPYPLLATSPYYELSLNQHYDNMFERCPDGLLLYAAYPFVLDSLGVPSTMYRIAQMLEPEASVVWGSTHAFVDVTFGGETHSYGGAGRGGNDPLFTEDAGSTFVFDGSANDLAFSSIAAFEAQFDSYSTIAANRISAYRDLIAGDTFCSTIRTTGGTWVRVATERGGFGTTFSYIVPMGSSYKIASEVWIDGRYIDKFETINLGVPLDTYPESDILVHDVTFTDYYGVTRTQDVIYSYYPENDDWEARFFYTGAGWYSGTMVFPDELILSRAEVEAIKASWTEGSRLPETGLIYDGTAYPGTPFTNVLVTGLSLPSEFTATIGRSYALPVTVLPENATYPQVTMIAADPEIVSCGSGAYFTAMKPGVTTVTVRTNDGRFIGECVVTVEKDYALNEALNVENGRLEFKSTGDSPFDAVQEDDRLAARLEGPCSYYDACLETTISMNAGDSIRFEFRFGQTGYYNRLYMFANNTMVMQTYAGSTDWRTAVYTAQESGEFTFKWRAESSAEDFFVLIDNVSITRLNPVSYTVTFVDMDGTVLSVQEVGEGEAASAPSVPAHEGWTFIGWDTEFDCVWSDLTVTAVYEENVPPVTVLLGDVDFNGEVNMADLALASSYVQNTATVTDQGVLNGDVNGDGLLTVADLAALYSLILG